ncbi:hypothetical protein FRC17_008722 [Serendipita sp. 399]|nr:hypothetical protein FRC17_008722 [Serendipita sp. 399]
MSKTLSVPTLEELAMFSSEVFLCEPCLRNTPAIFCRHFWTLPKPDSRGTQWEALEEAHRQVALLWMKRRLEIPLYVTTYDEVITHHYLRADASNAESRIGEFLRYGWVDGNIARFGWEVLWEYSNLLPEEIQQLHRLLVICAEAQANVDDRDITGLMELHIVELLQQHIAGDDIGAEREAKGGNSRRLQEERASNRKRL